MRAMFLSLAYDFWVWAYITKHDSLLQSSLEFNQKVSGCPCSFHATIAQCHHPAPGHSGSSQGPQLDETMYVFFPDMKDISGTMKSSQQGGSPQVSSSLTPCSATKVVSSAIESCHLIVVGNQQPWQEPVLFGELWGETFIASDVHFWPLCKFKCRSPVTKNVSSSGNKVAAQETFQESWDTPETPILQARKLSLRKSEICLNLLFASCLA